MPIIKINDKDYEFDQLPDQAKAQLGLLRHIDDELRRIKAQGAVLQIARAACGKALTDALPLPMNQTTN